MRQTLSAISQRAARLATAILALVTLTGCAVQTMAETVTVTYLANEGFLIEAGDRAVLVDALFGEGLDGYPAVPKDLRRDLEQGRDRFSGVDCVLATHEHADHFEPRAVARFLSARRVPFISTEDVVALLLPHLASSAGPPPLALYPPRNSITAVDCGGVLVAPLRLHHGSLPVQNLAFLIDLGGFTALHVGDTKATRDDFRAFGLARRGIDLALLPAWLLTESRWLPVVAEIAPRHVAAMHLAEADAPPSWFGSARTLERRVEEIRRNFPGVWVPLEPLSEKAYSGAARAVDGAARLPTVD